LCEERSTVVKVLVGKKKGDRCPGFWAEFEGEEISSYEDTRGEKQIVYRLYKCPAGRHHGYRAHIADESNPASPVYELLPYEEDTIGEGLPLDYSETWRTRDIVAKFPMFLKDMDYFQKRRVGREA
jgi:hypothetical protein